jgi:hypothetical protein
MSYSIPQIAKAITGAVTSGAAALAVAVQAGSAGGSSIVASEWVTIALAAVAGGGLVFGVPNKAPAGQLAKPNVSEQDNL